MESENTFARPGRRFWPSRASREEALFFAVLAVIFVLMLALNMLTPIVGDDYPFSFEQVLAADDTDGTLTAGRTNSLASIFRSIGVLRQREGGRVFSYFFIEYFLMVGKSFFNAPNALMFTLALFLLCRAAMPEKRCDVRILLLVFFLYWFFLPAFGQTNFWLTAALVYIWPSAIAMGFLYPYFRFYRGSEIRRPRLLAALWLPMGLLAGWFSMETIAPACCALVAFFLLNLLMEKRKIPLWMLLGLIGVVIGTALLLFVPGNFARNADYGGSAVSGIKALAKRFLDMAVMCIRHGKIILFASVAAYVPVLLGRFTRREKLLPGFVFAAAFLAHCAMVFVAIYSQRTMFGIMLFDLLGIALCASLLLDRLPRAVPLVVLLCAGLWFVVTYNDAAYDLSMTQDVYYARDAYVAEQKAQGNLDVIVEKADPLTRYNPLYDDGITDVLPDETAWANRLKAKYYGVDTLRSAE